MGINYKPADKEDMTPVYELNKTLMDAYENIDTIHYQQALSQVKSYVETHIQEYICVMLNEEKAGYYHLCYTVEQMEIDDLFLFPQFRGLGIGSELMRKFISETRLPITLCVYIKNIRAVAFYQKFGFQITEIYNGTRYIMQRNGQG